MKLENQRFAVFQDLPEVPEGELSQSEEGEWHEDRWIRNFTTSAGEDFTVSFINVAPDRWEAEFNTYSPRGGRVYKPTKKGGQWEVYGQVLATIKEFIASAHPEAIYFEAAVEKQEGLYSKLAERFMPGAWSKRGSGRYTLWPQESQSRTAVFQDLPDVPQWEGEAKDHDTRVVRSFSDEGEEYQVTFDKEGSKRWHVNFHMWGDTDHEVFSPTGKGNKWGVYGKVLSIIKEFVATKKPPELRFEGASWKQDRLYSTFLDRFVDSSAVTRTDGGYLVKWPHRNMKASRQAVFQNLELPEIEGELIDMDEEGDRYWAKDFNDKEGKPYLLSMGEDGDGMWTLNLSAMWKKPMDRMSPTGEGIPFDVYGRVLALLQQFIDEVKPKGLKLSVFDDKLERVYRKMFNRFFPGQWSKTGDYDYEIHPTYNEGPPASRRSRVSQGIKTHDSQSQSR